MKPNPSASYLPILFSDMRIAEIIMESHRHMKEPAISVRPFIVPAPGEAND